MSFALPSGDVKTVAHYHGCRKAPDWVFDAENSIDRALHTERWVGKKIDYKPLHPER